MTISLGRRAILALTVLSGLMVGWPARAQNAFDIKRVDKNDLFVGSAATGLHWAPRTRTLFATTVNGRLAGWTLPESFDRGAVVPRPDTHRADSLASFLIAGSSYELLTAGFAAQPRVGWAAGANVGSFEIENVRAVYPDHKSGSVAVLCSDKVVLLNRAGNAATPAPLNTAFGFLTWIDGPDGKSRLGGYDPKAGEILLWEKDAWSGPSKLKIRLPVFVSKGGQSSPVALTCVSQGTQDGTFVTGDDGGILRTWSVSGRTDLKSVPLDPVAVAVFSGDGTTLVQQEKEMVILRRRPFEGTKTVEWPAPQGELMGLRHDKWDEAEAVAGAWKMEDTEEPRVDLFRVGQGSGKQLKPPAGTEGRVAALAISPVEDRVVAAIRKTGLVMFSDQAPPAPVKTVGDGAIVDIHFASDGESLIAVGRFAYLCDKDAKELDRSEPLVPNGDAGKITACHLDLDKWTTAGKMPVFGRLLLGTSDGQVSFWKLEIKGGKVKANFLGSTQFAKRPIRHVVLNRARALVTTESEAIIMQVSEFAADKARVLVPLERLNSDDAVIAGAFASPTEVVYRIRTAAVSQPLLAARVYTDNAKPLTRIANRGADLVAAAADGTLFAKTATGFDRVVNKDPVTDMAISDDGKILLSALARDQGTLRRWQIKGGIPYEKEDQAIPGGRVTSVQFGQATDTMYVGTSPGGISRVRWPAQGAADVDLPMSDAPPGVVQLARLPMSAGANVNFDRLLVVDKRERLSLRWTADWFNGPLLAKVAEERYPSPWYGAALRPDLQSAAIVSADGQVRKANWSFPRKLIGYDPDFRDLCFEPFIKQAKPSLSPLYAVVWSDKFRTPAPAGAPIVAGADGTLYVPEVTKWKAVDLTDLTLKQPVYALAAHPTSPVLAAGFGTRQSPPVGREVWLSVWPEDTGFPKAKSRVWDGHKGPVRALAFSEDGKRLASVDDTGLLIFWDCGSLSATNVERPRFTVFPIGPSKPTSLAWLGATVPDALAVGLNDGRLWVLSVK